MDTSATLLESLQRSDDSQSWMILNDLYGPMIRNWLGRNNVRTGEQDDVAQEVLVLVSQKIGEFEHSGRTGAFRNWLKQITINCLRNHARKRANRQAAVGGSDFEAFLNAWADPKSQVSKLWRQEYQQNVIAYALRVAQQKFTEQTFQAFHMTAMLNENPDDVAEKLDMSVAAVYTARSRVLKELRQLKQGICDDE